jgi:hypothetical protein
MKSIEIKDVACFGAETFPLGALVLIQSKNGLGKTALINCIKYQFGRGHDPDMVADGNVGVIVTEFEDGTTIRTRITKDSTERSYKPAGSKRFIVKREFIDSMANALSYDPLAFLQRPEKEQIAEILRIMPVEIDAAEMVTAIEPLGPETGKEIADSLDLVGRSPLEVVNVVRDAVYQARTTEHVGADTLEKHASELDAALKSMSLDGTDWEAEVRRLSAERAALDSKESQTRDNLNSSVRECIATEGGKCDKLMLIREQEIERDIAKLRADLAQYKAGCAAARDTAISAKKQACREALDSTIAGMAEFRQQLNEKIGQAEQAYANSLKATSTAQAMEAAKAGAVVKRQKQKAMTEALQRIDELKATVAARLPLPCTIHNGRICREEGGVMVPLAKWNDASKYQFCLKLGVMAHGTAGFICIDSGGYDAFDPQHRQAFMAAARKYIETEGLQFIVASVWSGDLQVTDLTEGE